MADDVDRSPSGAPIFRHRPCDDAAEPAMSDPESIAAITQHVERHIGPIGQVFHELISELVHIDVHWVAPTAKRNFHTLVTSGMSDRPMEAPVPTLRYAELMLCLPPEWPLSEEAFRDERYYWPIRQLKQLARLPHKYRTWLFGLHTVPNGDPAQPFADNTKLCGSALFMPMLAGKDFRQLELSPEKTIHFLSVIPLYREEMEFKLRKGFDALLPRLAKARVSELLRIDRANTCKKRWGLF